MGSVRGGFHFPRHTVFSGGAFIRRARESRHGNKRRNGLPEPPPGRSVESGITGEMRENPTIGLRWNTLRRAFNQ